MAVRMGVSKEKLEGTKPVPNGIYEIQLSGFEPKPAKNGESINMNPVLKIVNNPNYNGQRVFDNMNQKGAWIWPDIAHAFGLPMELHPTGENGEEEAHLPGGPDAWVPDDANPDDVTKMKYTGPLLGETAQVELVYEHKPQQKPRNVIKQWICRIKDCSTKFPEITHNTNLIK